MTQDLVKRVTGRGNVPVAVITVIMLAVHMYNIDERVTGRGNVSAAVIMLTVHIMYNIDERI